jgi:hypothetical protein
MPTPLSPPEYPDRPDAPLFSFGQSFGEEISRSVCTAVFREDLDHPREESVRLAASLTMLEAFKPADHLQCMIAAQGVAFHASAMDCLARAIHRETPPALALKFHLSAARMRTAFSGALADVLKLQGRAGLDAPRRRRATPAPDPDADDCPSAGAAERAEAMNPPQSPDPARSDDLPNDMRTRPDGTPGSLAGYRAKPPKPIIPKEAAINLALATRPKLWRQVNVPRDQAVPSEQAETVPPAEQTSPVPPEPPASEARGPLDLREDLFRGDALARFASSRLDPDAPVPEFETDEAIFELEMISTGGDPEAEAHRAALIAAHPEGKPIAIIRYGANAPARIPDEDEPPDTS